MEPFAFHPALFELRTEALELLAEHGFEWLSDFGAIDLIHNIYGLEVCGVRKKSHAHAIERLLRKQFPTWRHSHVYYIDSSSREQGWKVIVSRDSENDGENWDRVS